MFSYLAWNEMRERERERERPDLGGSQSVGAVELGVVCKLAVSLEGTGKSLVGLQLGLHPHRSIYHYCSPVIQQPSLAYYRSFQQQQQQWI